MNLKLSIGRNVDEILAIFFFLITFFQAFGQLLKRLQAVLVRIRIGHALGQVDFNWKDVHYGLH